jgi:hypothetical protein
VVPEDVLATGAAHFASHASTSLVHRYEKRAWGMQWEGLVDRAGVARVFALNVGERKQ